MKRIFEKTRDMTKEEVIETLNLALKEAKEQCTNIELAQEILKVFKPGEVAETLAKLRSGKYLN